MKNKLPVGVVWDPIFYKLYHASDTNTEINSGDENKKQHIKWAAACQNQHNDLCAQSDQSLCYALSG